MRNGKVSVCRTMETKVVHVNKEPCDVVIDRSSIWGNPFDTGPRSEKIRKYEEYLMNNEYLMSRIEELRGKTLGCWCKPKACHGDVIVNVLNGLDLVRRLNNE